MDMDVKPNITDFSHELLCHILKYLPLREILSVAMLCKKMLAAVNMHLQLCKSIDFCQDSIFGYMPSSITDDHLLTLLKKCPHLEIVYGLHPVKIERRRLRKRAALTIPGIIEALSLCFHLKAIETSDLRLFEAIMQHLPQLEIIGHFQNRNGLFPPQASQRLKLQPYPRISSLHLIGVEVPELTAMPHLQHLHLQCVRFTKLQPFRAFLAQNLKSFVMKHCIGPSVPQRYLSLIIALSSSPNLKHLELVRVPLLNGLFQRAVEDSYRHNGFVNLKTLVISGCKGILEADLGHIMIVASKNLETLYIQPSLTKDSLFVSLSFAQCSFPVLRNLHLGYIDNLNSSGEWSNDTLLSFGLAEVPDTPSSLTDSGMKVISRLFPNIKTLSVSNCPHLMVMYQWMAEEDLEAWSRLTDLTLQKCHCLQLSSFVLFLSFLPNIQVVILNDMFREPPKGCSHVGLSAGTGLGMSSAVVSNQDEHIAVQGHHQEFEPPGDEENEEIDREFIDGENEDNPEPQFMVLQRDFFDNDEDDEVGDPAYEREQDLLYEAQGLNLLGNEPSDDFLAGQENYVCNPSSTNNKHVSPEVSNHENQSHSISGSKYSLRNSSKKVKPSKSDSMQTNTLSNDHSYSKTSKETINIKDETVDDNCCNSNNNSKVSTCKSENMNDYDPYKPSTSKAGSHLDYSDWDEYKASEEDEYKCSTSTKRLNKYSDEQSLTKKQKKSLKIIKNIAEDHKDTKSYEKSYQNNLSENSINNYNDHKATNCSIFVKEELPENSCCAERNSNEIPASANIDKIPANMECYVVVEKMETQNNRETVSHSENIDNNGTVKVNNLSGNVSNCNSLNNSIYKNVLNNNHKTTEKSTGANDELSEKGNKKKYPLSENDNECSKANNGFNDSYKTKADSDDCKPKMNELQNIKNMHYTSDLNMNHKIPINCSLMSNFDSTGELSEIKADTDAYERPEHEILLDPPFNEATEDSNCKAEIKILPICEEVTSISDVLHSQDDENSSASETDKKFCKKEVLSCIQSDSITTHSNSVATQTYPSGLIDTDSEVKSNSLNENTPSLIHSPINKSLEMVKDDVNESNKNLIIKENSSSEPPSKNVKFDGDASSSKIIKPCYVLVTKIDDPIESFGDESENKTLKKSSGDSLLSSNGSEIFVKKEPLSENMEECNSSQPSTSRAGTDFCDSSNEHSESFKKMHSSEYFKNGKSSITTRSKNICTIKMSSKNEAIKIEHDEDVAENNSHTHNIELSSHNTREQEFAETYKNDSDYDEDSKFYISLSNNGPLQIINSITGESYQMPDCHVVVNQMNDENCDNLDKRQECKDKHELDQNSQKASVKQCDINLEFNPNLPSTSKAENGSNSIPESVTYSDSSYEMHEKKQNYVKCENCKKIIKCCCSDPEPVSYNTKRICIKNSDAKILLKKCSNEEDSKHKAQQEILRRLGPEFSISYDNEDIERMKKYHSYIGQNVKVEANDTLTSGNPSYTNETDHCNISENNEYSSFEEKPDISSGCTQRKRRRRNCFTSTKRMRKIYDSKVNLPRDNSKNNSKRSIPMISVVSEGTQATSADIRRSVRRIRRAASQRKTVPPGYAAKCRYSSKISAKILSKKPYHQLRPELHDKATSTSDPLLEDDAVQTLQLSSSTLLSFTVVSCGISDLIIDRCPKLTHIEVQACRILKRFQFNNCPVIKRLNVSQCPKLSICALAAPIMSLSTDSYFVVSYEPCMQGYHHGEGEKAILSKASVNQSVLILHDFCDISYDGIQAKFRERTLEWLRFLSQLYLYLNYTRVKKKKHKSEVYQFSEYPWSHDLRRIHGHYSYSASSDFCGAEGRYQLLSNNPILCDIFETHQLDSGFPEVRDCAAFKNPSLISYEVIEKYLEMQKKFIAFYIPVTENNQINF